jgi:hypothetical protein
VQNKTDEANKPDSPSFWMPHHMGSNGSRGEEAPTDIGSVSLNQVVTKRLILETITTQRNEKEKGR